MESPKSHKHKEKRVSYKRREHKNKKFYNSKAWRDTREAYLRHYKARLYKDIPEGKWDNLSLKAHQVSYILSLSYLPCETCLRLFCAEAYDKVEEGKELDHIISVNPENATNRIDVTTIEDKDTAYLYGHPYDFNNLQLLCRTHHAKKSQREKT